VRIPLAVYTYSFFATAKRGSRVDEKEGERERERKREREREREGGGGALRDCALLGMSPNKGSDDCLAGRGASSSVLLRRESAMRCTDQLRASRLSNSLLMNHACYLLLVIDLVRDSVMKERSRQLP